LNSGDGGKDLLKVVSFLKLTTQGKTGIAYTVAFYEQGNTEPRTVLKTYSQLLAFHKRVNQAYASFQKKSIPKFPSKKRIGSTMETTRKQLDSYFQEISKIPTLFESNIIRDFVSDVTPTRHPINKKSMTEEEILKRRNSLMFEEKKKTSELNEGVGMGSAAKGIKVEHEKKKIKIGRT